MHAYRYLVLSSTRAQAGALELCHCSYPTAEMLLGSLLSPGMRWAPSTGVTPAWNLTLPPCFGGRECSHAWTGTRPWQVAKAHGDTSAGATDTAGTLPGNAQPGVLSRMAFLEWALYHGWKKWGTTLQCTSLAACALRKSGGCMQASPFKSSSMTARKKFLMGSKPSSTCGLYLLN